MEFRDEVVVVFTVDEKNHFLLGGVGGEIHETADSIAFLADVVVLFLEFLKMSFGKGHGLGAWEAKRVSA